MTKYEARRLSFLWLPIVAAGAIINAWSYTITLTMNGLTLAGVTLIAAGTLAAAIDHDRGRP
ncbi:hypothetical protein [Brevibacterium otitidis]|uniref:SPW repeat-containing protein n=1 Tax=Brevibacterium otitidis TaxID=53364 RepID=A0ABV5X4N4_9MICO|nr:hypothetical protein GCM10023233_23000 [Brevibacterium otitidis]